MTLLTGISLKLPVFIDQGWQNICEVFNIQHTTGLQRFYHFCYIKGKLRNLRKCHFPSLLAVHLRKIEKSRTHRAIDYQQVTERLLMQVFANRFFFSIY